MMGCKGKRGRPREIRPVFDDPDAERLRVERCIREGRDPYPEYKHEPCAAELELRKDIMPGVPFALVVQLNDTDFDGYPLDHPAAEAAWNAAQAKRRLAASSGGEMRERRNLAAEVIAENAYYIRTKRAEGAKKSEVIKWLNDRRSAAGLKRAGRSEMYEQLRVSGLWD